MPTHHGSHTLTLKGPQTLNTLASRLREELEVAMDTYTGRFGLEDFCFSGGTIREVEAIFDEDTFEFNGSKISGSFDISFDESYHAGCRDTIWSNHFSGSGSFTYDSETGEVEVETTAEHVPEEQPSDYDLSEQAH